jgi:23S rRNA pseudouridine2605 synthase
MARTPSRDSGSRSFGSSKKSRTSSSRDSARKPTSRDSARKVTTGSRDEKKPGAKGPRDFKKTSKTKKNREDKARRPRMTKGPWGDSVYVTSGIVKPKGTSSKPKVTPVKKSLKPAVTPVVHHHDDAEAPVREKGPAKTKAIAPGLLNAEGKEERLQKVLARCGIASRRQAEVLILEGAVTVNGRLVTELGTKVNQHKDKIKVNGKMLFTEIEPVYLALYKPRGYISSLADPEGRPHLGTLLAGIKERVVPIGRMDFNSEGLILLTNDGELHEKIFKARNVPRVYMLKIKGHPTQEDLEFLKNGIFTAQGVVRFAAYNLEQALRNKSWLKLEVIEGANLDIRELLNMRGIMVDRIVRTAIGNISSKGLEPGQYRVLKRRDFEALAEIAQVAAS